MDNVIYPRFGLRSTRSCGAATKPADFRSEVRAAQIAADLSHQNGYGLYATQSFQREAVRFMRSTGVSAYEAAHRIVRGPREPFFGGHAA
jgi:hypothetical protein